LQANRLVLDAALSERGELRFTPAGMPALDFTLRHASRQVEVGTERSIECELAGVAFGDVARGLAQLPLASVLRCKGFLARRWRTGITLAMHVHEFELMTNNIQEDRHASSSR
jgi:primosomal replication protein N